MSDIILAEAGSLYDQINNHISSFLDNAYSVSVGWVLMICLLGAGIYFTLASKALQFRHFNKLWRSMFHSRKGAEGGISSFQAFAMGLADRVGTGTIAGVALAVVAGGAGAVFWMWIVALLGMATAFVEATLAQIFKIRNKGDGAFRGGPAYYIQRGLGSRGWGALFACLLLFAYGFTFQMTQANTVAAVAGAAIQVGGAPFPAWATALILVVTVSPVVIGGVKKVAQVSEYLAPIMAIGYVIIAVVIILFNLDQIPRVFGDIFAGAFGGRAVVGGALGGFFAALTNGIKRGLYTNEAGMGSAPNAAATATTKHPVTQGFIQSLGVFIDTMILCTATAFIILVAGVYDPTKADQFSDGAALTAQSIATDLGGWSIYIVLILILVFGYSTILGNFAYAEANWRFLVGPKGPVWPVKALALFATALGSVMSLAAVWSLTDWASALMAITNLVAIVALGKWAFGALKDWEVQKRAGIAEPQFTKDSEFLPRPLDSDCWPTKNELKQQETR